MGQILKFKVALTGLLGFCIMMSGCAEQKFQRIGQIAKLQPEKTEILKQIYSSIEPDVAKALKKANFQNCSVYLKSLEPGQPSHVFRYLEYTGGNLEKDTAKLKANPKIKNWCNKINNCLTYQSADGKKQKWINVEDVFYHGGRLDAKLTEPARFGAVVGLRPKMVDSYVLLHKYPWPELLAGLDEVNIRNYTVFLHKENKKYYLFSFMEYIGDDFAADMAKNEADPPTVAWMKFTDEGCQLPIPTRKPGEWWADMEEIFHQH